MDTTGDDACDGAWTATTLRQVTLSLAAGTTYHWQIRARTAGGTTLADAGAWWRFSTATTSTPAFTDDPPVAVSPRCGRRTSPSCETLSTSSARDTP